MSKSPIIADNRRDLIGDYNPRHYWLNSIIAKSPRGAPSLCSFARESVLVFFSAILIFTSNHAGYNRRNEFGDYRRFSDFPGVLEASA